MESYHSGREKALTLLTILDNINCKYSCTITPQEAVFWYQARFRVHNWDLWLGPGEREEGGWGGKA